MRNISLGRHFGHILGSFGSLPRWLVDTRRALVSCHCYAKLVNPSILKAFIRIVSGSVTSNNLFQAVNLNEIPCLQLSEQYRSLLGYEVMLV